ncbi:MAG: hypothetical protein ACFFG0_04130 [Candidatus Thorarchaeota archaeon]
MNRKITILVLILIFGLASTAFSKPNHSIEFKNYSKRTVSAYLYRVDHGLKNHEGAVNCGVITLKTLKTWSIKCEEGIYYVIWKLERTGETILVSESFKLDKDTLFLIGSLPLDKSQPI